MNVREAQAILEKLAAAVAPPQARRLPGRGEKERAPAAPRQAPASSTSPAVEGPAGPKKQSGSGQPTPLFGQGDIGKVLEGVPDALIIVAPDGNIVLVNSHTESLFLYGRDELKGQPVELLVPDRFRIKHVGQRNSYFANPHVRPMGAGLELFGRRKNGQEFPVEISLSPLATDDGRWVMATIRDISERKRAEAQLRKAEARYRTLVEEIPAVTFMAALDEGVNELYVSPQIEALLGFSQKEWLQDPVLWHSRLHPEDRDRWHLEFAHTCATGAPFKAEYRFVARNGHIVWVRGEAKVFKDDTGRPLFLQGVAFDITAMKQAEQELMALNQTLEQRVAERSALAEERAHELARSNAELEKFAYVASHDLREPLRTLKNYPKLLAQRYTGKLDEMADDFMQRIIRGAENMEMLINDLSKYSRVVRGERAMLPTDSGRVFAAACANLQAAIEESGAEVTAADFPIVLANETELVLLFQNLIGNAVKFRAERPVRVHVEVRRQEDDWLFAFRDNGIGIEPQYLKKIFALGERLHSKRLYAGTGFGLAICEKIVEAHRGRIWVESEPGAGSTFFFTLPAT